MIPHQSPSLLAIDTSGDVCSVALWHRSQLTSLAASNAMAPSQHVIDFVRQLLTQADLALAALDALVLGAGPGSFTGVRTAASVVQGLAYGACLPVISVGTLEALALEKKMLGKVAIAIDARMQEVYFAVYNVGERTVEELLAPAVAPYAVARSMCASLGVELAAEVSVPGPLAPVMLVYARRLFEQGKLLSPGQAQPVYVRHKVALTTLERERIKNDV